MLRSTSLKNDSWKPVKLLARQSVESKLIDICLDSNSDKVFALSNDCLRIFSNHQLLDSVSLDDAKKIANSVSSGRNIIQTASNLFCFDSWGKKEWEFSQVNSDSQLSFDSNKDLSLLTESNNLILLDSYGELIFESHFESKILDSAFSPSAEILVSTESGLFLISRNWEIKSLQPDVAVSKLYCTRDYFIAILDNAILAMSYTGAELWLHEDSVVTDLSFCDMGNKHVFILNSKTLVCQDRNGEILWKYRSNDELCGSFAMESGEMTGVFSNTVFHIIDSEGNQAWSYQAREKINAYSFSLHGGDIVIASEYKVHWFQNEGFLRLMVDEQLINSRHLLSRIEIYENGLEPLSARISEAELLSSRNFDSLKKAFKILNTIDERLKTLHNRHVDYLDDITSFMRKLGLEEVLTDEMVPPLYEYYSVYTDISNVSELKNLLEKAKHNLKKLNQKEDADISSLDKGQQIFLKDSKSGISKEINNIEDLLRKKSTNAKALELDIGRMIMNWLKTGILSSESNDLLGRYRVAEEKIVAGRLSIEQNIDGHMAFASYSDNSDHLSLDRFEFVSKEKIALKVSVKNVAEIALTNIFLRIKVEGRGLSLISPPSGLVTLERLDSGESYSPKFEFETLSRNSSRVFLVLQYMDATGRFYSTLLGDIISNFMGCQIKPFKMTSDEHDALRLKYKDFTSHSAINIEGLTINKITRLSKNISGLYLCDYKDETSRSILYYSAKSTIDDSNYLCMIFLRTVGKEASLRNALELVCHASDLAKSTELRDELLSTLKNQLLESGGRLI